MEGPSGVVVSIPGWMVDPLVCADMSVGRPQVDLAALTELRRLVTPEVHLGTDVLVPDIAGWRHETMPEYPKEAFTTIVPDWVCEVLSPATRTHDVTDKRDIYGSFGVRHIWFVDPDARTALAACDLSAATCRDVGADGAQC